MVIQREKGKLRIFVTGFMQLMLLAFIFVAWSQGRTLVLLFATTGLIITFIPTIIEKTLKKRVPAAFEILVLMFLYGFLLFWNVSLVRLGIWWWDIIISVGSAVILGLIGLTVLSVLNKEEIIDANSAMIAFFAFCFAFSLGSLWELLEFGIDILLKTSLQQGLTDTMRDLTGLLIGAAMTAFGGYRYLHSGKEGLFSLFVFNFMRKNWKIFRSKNYFEYSSSKIQELIQRGESDTVEFKTTLRKNLYTKKIDKEIEHATMKTIAAYLNTKGGTLLIGVEDSGKIAGLEADEFTNHDKLKLYLNQLFRKQLGNSVLKNVQYEVYPVKDKHVLKIECNPSSKRVFLKRDGNETFYVRYGPSTVQLKGGDLIDYVNEHFE